MDPKDIALNEPCFTKWYNVVLLAMMNSIRALKYMTDPDNKFMKFNIVWENAYEHSCMVTNKNIGESHFPYIFMDQAINQNVSSWPGVQWNKMEP
jgi:hypothetical protein